MFLKTSRYANTPQVQRTLADGTQCAAVQLRTVSATPGDPFAIDSNDRLDIIALRSYNDATRYWHIADANTALDAQQLFEPWLEDDRDAQPLSIVVPEN